MNKNIIIGVVVVLVVAGIGAYLYLSQGWNLFNSSRIIDPEQEIQYRLAQKYNKPVADVTVTATKKTADYMVGRVSFAAKGLPVPGEGGMFLAAKEGNIWT